MDIAAKSNSDKSRYVEILFDFTPNNRQSTGSQITSSYSQTTDCLWLTMSSKKYACFTSGLLHDFTSCLHLNQQKHTSIKAIVLTSANPKIFSFGGDLAYIRNLIIKYDREALFNYIKLNLDVIFNFASHFQQLRIAQVTGAALDGGFEAALASDVIIAERQATFGFSDNDIKLFPCLGASYYLTRKAGARMAQQILSGTKRYTADELAKIGVVDVVTETACSTDAVIRYINNHQKNGDANNSLKQLANRINQTSYNELLESCHHWVDNAMKFSGHDLRQIERIVKQQISSCIQK